MVCQSWLLEETLNEKTSRLNICLSFGIAVADGIYIEVDVSGGHINPAATIGTTQNLICVRIDWKTYILVNAILGRLGGETKENAKMFVLYWIAQIAGAFWLQHWYLLMQNFIYSRVLLHLLLHLFKNFKTWKSGVIEQDFSEGFNLNKSEHSTISSFKRKQI